jgi:uncharacterized protein YbcI
MDRAETVSHEDGDRSQSLLLTVSNEMVRIYKEQFGRGPTKVRTDWAGPDVLISTLRESLTAAERNLADMGEFHRLRDTRTFFQYAGEHEFVGAIEQIVGRKVVAFVSGIDARRDVSAEVFYFEPRA